MRGTGIMSQMAASETRITPACAGNSVSDHLTDQKYRDHPRVCGEQAWKLHPAKSAAGSPPRVRGTEKHDGGLLLGQRITPACAGNSGWCNQAEAKE